MQYFAHSNTKDDSKQLLINHLLNTAQIAQSMGEEFGIGNLAYIAGLLHDIGKYSLSFQKRLFGGKLRVDHSTAGAREAISLVTEKSSQKIIGELLAYCIAGHHTGLPDSGSNLDEKGERTLRVRLDPEKTIIDDYSTYRKEIDTGSISFDTIRIKPIKRYPGFSVSFLTRMLYSVLVDADWIETETYAEGITKPRGKFDSLEILCCRLNKYLQKFEAPDSAINKKRTDTLKNCREKAILPPGIFTLTIPTGGGKTLSSMAFALNHAIKNKQKRVIYVIPFTGIIEQNAAIFKEVLGKENVLEHHSNFDWDSLNSSESADLKDDESTKLQDKLKLAVENWDIPVVVTTNVQFFESLFACSKSRCRKLHNIANSVIIFDEAQVLPREYLQPCMLAVQELVQNYHVSAVFCTATQPALKQFMPDYPDFIELADKPHELFTFYKRTNIINDGILKDDELLLQINNRQQGLCIVNTRRHAKGLFEGINEEGRYHLSTLMCPAHRKEILLQIKDQLQRGETCHVISTQVMEAGIDIDFPVGWRALAGLDSIIQAAGRVNREGKQKLGELHVFEPDSEWIKRIPAFIRQTGDVTRNILREYWKEPVSIDAINAYYRLLYTLQDKSVFDIKNILSNLTQEDGFDFRIAADKLKLIENYTHSILIPYNSDAQEILEELKKVENPVKILRKLQLFTVNVYENEFNALEAYGFIDMINERYALLNDSAQYDLNTGIILPLVEGGKALFFE